MVIFNVCANYIKTSTNFNGEAVNAIPRKARIIILGVGYLSIIFAIASGASIDEAVLWGKIHGSAKTVKVLLHYLHLFDSVTLHSGSTVLEMIENFHISWMQLLSLISNKNATMLNLLSSLSIFHLVSCDAIIVEK